MPTLSILLFIERKSEVNIAAVKIVILNLESCSQSYKSLLTFTYFEIINTELLLFAI